MKPFDLRLSAAIAAALPHACPRAWSSSGRCAARRRPRTAIGLFETDEAALPDALDETQPRLVLLHNLFRDQLDRYSEVDTIATRWRAALERLPAEATVLLNADDRAVAALGEGLAARVAYYGLEDVRHTEGSAAHIADSQFCRHCGEPHWGLARNCPGCHITVWLQALLL